MMLKLGWRNIWRNKRRSLLTILAIAFATFLTVVFFGFTAGIWEYNVANSVEMFAGYLQIQKQGYLGNPSLNKSFSYPDCLEQVLSEINGVTGYAPRIQADGLISYKESSAGTSIIGIDPMAERHISRFHERVKKGQMVDQRRIDEIVVGFKLLENLKAHVDDTLVLLAQGFDGVMGNQKYRVTGAMKFGSSEIDAAMVVMNIHAAQELLAMEGRVNIIAIGTKGLHSVDDVQSLLQSSLQQVGLTQLEVLPWTEVMPELKQGMDFDQINHSLFQSILILVVAFGVLNTVLMSVTERFREFGITLALGIKPSGLVKIVFLETIFITIIGIAAGCILGQGVNIYFAHHPIILGGQLAQYYEEYGFLPMMTTSERPIIPLIVSGVIFLICLIASIYPLYRVSQLEPLKGIRHT
jgi:ABC-type lipoprotein release transport system permease subunit